MKESRGDRQISCSDKGERLATLRCRNRDRHCAVVFDSLAQFVRPEALRSLQVTPLTRVERVVRVRRGPRSFDGPFQNRCAGRAWSRDLHRRLAPDDGAEEGRDRGASASRKSSRDGPLLAGTLAVAHGSSHQARKGRFERVRDRQLPRLSGLRSRHISGPIPEMKGGPAYAALITGSESHHADFEIGDR